MTTQGITLMHKVHFYYNISSEGKLPRFTPTSDLPGIPASHLGWSIMSHTQYAIYNQVI